MIRLTTAGITAAALVAAAPLSATAHAQARGPLFFRAGNFNCAISPDGTAGCDLTTAMKMTIRLGGADFPMPFQVRQIVIDTSRAPVRPTFGSGNYTRPQGNPNIEEVATGRSMWGPEVTYAGATCGFVFQGSFWCSAKGHSFASYVGTIGAS